MKLIKYLYHVLMIKDLCQILHTLAYFHKDCNKKCDKNKNENKNKNKNENNNNHNDK